MLVAEHALAKLLADERERSAVIVEKIYPDAASLLRNETEPVRDAV